MRGKARLLRSEGEVRENGPGRQAGRERRPSWEGGGQAERAAVQEGSEGGMTGYWAVKEGWAERERARLGRSEEGKAGQE